MNRDAETKKYRKLMKEADHLIFIYPLWWGGVPAIMKGFLTECLSPEKPTHMKTAA